MAKKLDIPKDNNIVKIPLEEAMPDNYLPYAVEVAKDRALPDVRDGLKPVHRRIIYGAHMLRAYPDKPYYKSARIVGDILGKYHPHGDTSVYDAMIILAQDFSTRMPLIDGHGNWGSQDGDNAAAMRYTEARMTPLAMEMIKDIEKGVVNMVDNYSGSELEPEVLPVRYPNLLVNGTFGIAVGLATNIPPHNLNEVIDASISLIDNPEITTKELMEFVKGPDLPTGGIIIGKNSLISAYETGEGRVTLRAKADIEKLENGRLGIVITEFPYRRSKAKILQIISEMTADKRHSKALEPISDIRDESDRNGIRAVIELKKSVDEESAEKILKYLYKKTDLQCNISFNMVALAKGKPEIMGLKTILSHFIEHQKDVITRRTKRELEIAEKRFHIVEGFIKAIDIMDAIIEVIRASKSKKDAQSNLVSKFGFTDVQAEAILELMLYRLTGLEIKVFQKEYNELEKDIKRLKRILENEKELLKVIKKEIIDIKEKYGDARRTKIIEDDEKAKIDVEELIIEEDVMITMSNEGFIKRIPTKSYNRSNTNVEEIEYREGDFNKYLISSNTKDTIVFFTDRGNMYQLKVVNIPEVKWKDKGERVDTIIKGLDVNDEKIVSIYSIADFSELKDFIFFTSNGIIKKTELNKFITNYTKIMALKLKKEERLMDVKLVDRERKEGLLRIRTSLDLEFTIEEPSIEAADRGILGVELVKLAPSNEIISVEFAENIDYKEFKVNINKGNIKVYSNKAKHKGINVECNSKKQILIIDDLGNTYIVPALILQNTGENGIKVNELLGFDESLEIKIVNAIVIDNFDLNLAICFVTQKGMVKKTMLSEFKGDYFKTVGYKLKSEDDRVISAFLCDENSDIVLITKKAMSIRFDLRTINCMGKVASGVTGISLRDDDEVIYSVVLSQNFEIDIELIAIKGDSKKINTKEIKLQNRAGRGNNLMLVVMGDYIKEIK